MIDLHIHSHYSDDGEYSPQELLDIARSKGIRIMAIADHNCVRANREASKLAELYDIRYIKAIEIDCDFHGVKLHVLGYGVDDGDSRYQRLEENIRKQEISNGKRKIELTESLGFKVDQKKLDMISKDGVYAGEHFAKVLLNDEQYLDNELLRPYRPGNERGDNPYVNFFWDYYAQGKPCYTKVDYMSLEECVGLIHDTGGKAILAHPGNNLQGRFELFDMMVPLGIDGVEAFSSYHDLETCLYFKDKALAYGLIYTTGSDFHGKTKPRIVMGQTMCQDIGYIEKELIDNKLIPEES